MDRTTWLISKDGDYNVKDTYNDVRNKKEKVRWVDAIWFSKRVPRCSFLMWITFLNKMWTKDKLKDWEYISEDICVLCINATERRNHLFFNCVFSKKIQDNVIYFNGCQRDIRSFDEEVELIYKKSKNFGIIMQKISMSISMYAIWRERNECIFKNI